MRKNLIAVAASVIVTVGLPVTLGTPPGSAAAPEAPAGTPATIPALQEWTPATGAFTLRADPRVVVAHEDADALGAEAHLLATDLARMTTTTPSVATGAVPRPGDVVLSLDPDPTLGTEGYRLDVGDTFAITAPTTTGAFYGGRSLIQLMRQGTTVPAGAAKDQPRYPDRGLMVDAGRRYFPPSFYHRQIRQMAYLKLNLLHLHLSDDAGLGVESARHPESVAPQHLTKDEIRDIVELAQQHHIRVMPEIDMPGHMTGILRSHPELQLRNAFGQPQASRLDVTSPSARAFARDLIDEFLPLFPDAEWHIGADEYMPAYEYPLHPALATYARKKFGLFSNGKDAVHDFVNEMAAHLRANGRAPRIWNDDAGGGFAVRLDPRIVVEWWTDFTPLSGLIPPSPQRLLDRGHRVLNNGWWPTYFAARGLPAPDFNQAYDKWRVHDFYGTLYYNSTIQAPPQSVRPDEPDNLGSKLAIWSDGPVMTDQQILDGSLIGLRVVAQKTWKSPSPAGYDRFVAIATAIGDAPGTAED
ncbi:family 20 glycosylhydrolase [Nocardioides sp. GCM10030258]|uniref:family 20 glycosylhydrolase n=1 Tax=unclassified Nocardioides TaxID=2615069 RepID=UPI003610D67A